MPTEARVILDRSKRLTTAAREFMIARPGQVYWIVLCAATDVQRSRQGINAWGYRPINEGNVDGLASLFKELERRSDVLEKALAEAEKEPQCPTKP